MNIFDSLLQRLWPKHAKDKEEVVEAKLAWADEHGTDKTGSRLLVQPIDRAYPDEEFLFSDLIAFRKIETKGKGGKVNGLGDKYLLIAYPLREGVRRRVRYLVAVPQADGVDNQSIIAEMGHAKHRAIETRPWPHSPCLAATPPPRILVLVNPFSGQCKAMQLWLEHARPIFDEAEFTYEVVATKSRGDATRLALDLNLDAYSAVAIASGDGLISEWLLGVLQRSDYKRALRTPLLPLPGGTSNGLAAALAYQCNEPFPPRGIFCSQIALMLASSTGRRFRALSLYQVEVEDLAGTLADGTVGGANRIKYLPMFLNMGWGLFADVDICSERFRWAGMIRLHVEAFLRLIRLPSVARYRGKISYLPDPNCQQSTEKLRLKAQYDRRLFGAHHFDGEEVDVWRPTGGSPSIRNQPPSTGVEEVLRVNQSTAVQNAGGVPSLSEPVPASWESVEGEFVCVSLTSLSHLGSDLPYHPCARLEEEAFYLSFVEWNQLKSRFHMAHLMITIDQCTHLDYDCLKIIPVLACRVEPEKGAGGHVSLDGEEVCAPGSRFQVVASRLKATVVARENADLN